MSETIPEYDSNVERVKDQLTKRMEAGINKYGVTTERTDIDLMGWLQHLQEELMDATVYIERLKHEIRAGTEPTT